MTVQFSTVVRNALLDSMQTTIGVSARVQLWSGPQPTNCATAASGVKLAEWQLASTWSNPASGGVKSLIVSPVLTTLGLAAGSVGYYRFTDSTATVCHEQGAVSATGGGGDLTIDNIVIAVSQTIQITGFTKTAPGL